MTDSMRHLLRGALALSASAVLTTLAAREFMEANRSATIEGAATVLASVSRSGDESST